MNDGIVFLAPSAVASVTCGLRDGLLPPAAGWAWQEPQLLELNRGPRPEPGSMVPETESTSLNVFSAVLKNARLPAGLLAATEASGPPAAAAPVRTPGSVWAIALPKLSSVAMVSDKNGNFRLVIASSSSVFWIQD
jgi:hypothetical protein